MLKILVVGLAALFLTTGCLLVTTPGCDRDADCPTNTFCAEGACVPPGQIACNFDVDCPQTTYCETDGFCEFN